jgi:hypothetical protein
MLIRRSSKRIGAAVIAALMVSKLDVSCSANGDEIAP